MVGSNYTLRKTLAVSPNVVFDQRQTITLEDGTAIRIATGGNHWKQGVVKLIVENTGRVFFAWEDQFYAAL